VTVPDRRINPPFFDPSSVPLAIASDEHDCGSTLVTVSRLMLRRHSQHSAFSTPRSALAYGALEPPALRV